MKVLLKKAAGLFCAAVIIAACYPELENSTSFAETLESENSAKLNNTDDSTAEKPVFLKSASSSAGAATKIYNATAYALRGRTRSGLPVRRGVIAADPRILPLETKVQITAGTWSGTYLVADTGGAIKGHIIDVWMPNNAEARQFGRRKVILTILDK